MKKVILLAIAAGIVASPAAAQTTRRPATTERTQSFYGRQPDLLSNRAPTVYSGNRYVGTDPDANVRLDLRRNPEMDSEGG